MIGLILKVLLGLPPAKKEASKSDTEVVESPQR